MRLPDSRYMENGYADTGNKQKDQQNTVAGGYSQQAHRNGRHSRCHNDEVSHTDAIGQLADIRVQQGRYLHDGGKKTGLGQRQGKLIDQKRQ